MKYNVKITPTRDHRLKTLLISMFFFSFLSEYISQQPQQQQPPITLLRRLHVYIILKLATARDNEFCKLGHIQSGLE